MKRFRAVEEWLYNTPNIPRRLFKDMLMDVIKATALFATIC